MNISLSAIGKTSSKNLTKRCLILQHECQFYVHCAEPEYADELLMHSKQMLEFGLEHPGTYMKSKQEGLIDHGKHYPSSNFNDELSWGAIWLYFATGVSLNAIDVVAPH